MNYVLKSISPGSVFLNSIRIFLVVGFFFAVLKVFIDPSPSFAAIVLWQKVIATVIFTFV